MGFFSGMGLTKSDEQAMNTARELALTAMRKADWIKEEGREDGSELTSVTGFQTAEYHYEVIVRRTPK